MNGAYGGLIIILMSGRGVPGVLEELYLITQNGDPILTNLGQNILVTEKEQ